MVAASTEWPQYRIPVNAVGPGYAIPECRRLTDGWFAFASGYCKAAEVLFDVLVQPSESGPSDDKQGASRRTIDPKTDWRVMPAVFLYRHFVELALKAFLYEAGVGLQHDHGLPELWGGFKDFLACEREEREGQGKGAIALDNPRTRFLDRAELVVPAIDELAQVDPDSAVFRYPGTALAPVNVRTLQENLFHISFLLLEAVSTLIHDKQEFQQIEKSIRGAFERLRAEQEREGGSRPECECG